MAAGQQPANPNPSPARPPATEYPPVPQYSASGRPNTRTDRIAFQIWVVMFLLVLVVTLINFLAGSF